METQNQNLVMVEEYALTKKLYGPTLAKITSSRNVHQFMNNIYGDTWKAREYFYAIFLDRSNQVLGYELHSFGTITGTVMDAKMILASAILCSASAIIAVHNHPSGQSKPSDADTQITKNLQSASDLFKIKLLDHLIYCGPENYYSFADEGLLIN